VPDPDHRPTYAEPQRYNSLAELNAVPSIVNVRYDDCCDLIGYIQPNGRSRRRPSAVDPHLAGQAAHCRGLFYLCPRLGLRRHIEAKSTPTRRRTLPHQPLAAR